MKKLTESFDSFGIPLAEKKEAEHVSGFAGFKLRVGPHPSGEGYFYLVDRDGHTHAHGNGRDLKDAKRKAQDAARAASLKRSLNQDNRSTRLRRVMSAVKAVEGTEGQTSVVPDEDERDLYTTRDVEEGASDGGMDMDRHNLRPGYSKTGKKKFQVSYDEFGQPGVTEAKGNFRADRSHGCLYCGDRSQPEKLKTAGKKNSPIYLCPKCLEKSQGTREKPKKDSN